MKPRLNIVIVSTRPNRVGPAVAHWAVEAAQHHGGFEPVLVDLASFGLPVFDETEHPRLRKYQHAHTKAWSASVDSADAFVFVLPEYNHAPPAAFVNALNFVLQEWHYKPAAFVSYGGVSAGMRSVAMAKEMLNAMKVVPMLENVAVQHVAHQLDAERRFNPTEAQIQGARVMYDELLRWTGALRTLRKPA